MFKRTLTTCKYQNLLYMCLSLIRILLAYKEETVQFISVDVGLSTYINLVFLSKNSVCLYRLFIIGCWRYIYWSAEIINICFISCIPNLEGKKGLMMTCSQSKWFQTVGFIEEWNQMIFCMRNIAINIYIISKVWL